MTGYHHDNVVHYTVRSSLRVPDDRLQSRQLSPLYRTRFQRDLLDYILGDNAPHRNQGSLKTVGHVH